ncbi:unnamed protein product [Closterium sp. NIES-53]
MRVESMGFFPQGACMGPCSPSPSLPLPPPNSPPPLPSPFPPSVAAHSPAWRFSFSLCDFFFPARSLPPPALPSSLLILSPLCDSFTARSLSISVFPFLLALSPPFCVLPSLLPVLPPPRHAVIVTSLPVLETPWCFIPSRFLSPSISFFPAHSNHPPPLSPLPPPPSLSCFLLTRPFPSLPCASFSPPILSSPL